MKQNSNMYTVA